MCFGFVFSCCTKMKTTSGTPDQLTKNLIFIYPRREGTKASLCVNGGALRVSLALRHADGGRLPFFVLAQGSFGGETLRKGGALACCVLPMSEQRWLLGAHG